MNSSLLFLFKRNAGLGAAANNCNIPTQYNTLSSWVHNCWTTHKAGAATGYSNIQVTFTNWYMSTDSEAAGFYDFNLRAGLMYNGVFYPLTFGGQRDVLISHSFGYATSDPLRLYLPAGAVFYVTNRRIAADNGAAGSYSVLSNTSGIGARQDGIISGTDPTQDYTLGAGLAWGAKTGTPVISGGAISSVPVAAGGTGYTAGLNLAPWYGPAGAGQPGALNPGSGVTGYGNPSGGSLSSVTLISGGTGNSSLNPPHIYVAGGGTAANGFGSNTAAYGPSLITGRPAAKAPSVLLVGDSITVGYGSVDGMGDLNGNYGFYEQALANRYGVHKLAVSGEQAAGWLSNNTHQLNFLSAAMARGFKPTTVVIGLGVNDFLTDTYSNVLSSVQGNITAIANIFRTYGCKIIMTTIPPNNTTSASSNKYTTVAEQTPYNANYTSGSYVDQYNAALLAGSGPANDGIIDGGSLMRDATVHTAWRTDCYGGGTAFCAVDGTHPSVGVGIPYLTANLSIPTLF